MVPRDQFLATGVTQTQSSIAVRENSPSSIFSSLSLRERSKCSTVTSLICLPALSKRDLTSSVQFTLNFADSHWQRHDTLLLFFSFDILQGTSDTCNTRATLSRCAGPGSSAWRCRRVQEHDSVAMGGQQGNACSALCLETIC